LNERKVSDLKLLQLEEKRQKHLASTKKDQQKSGPYIQIFRRSRSLLHSNRKAFNIHDSNKLSSRKYSEDLASVIDAKAQSASKRKQFRKPGDQGMQ
jgi:hypothetical protein